MATKKSIEQLLVERHYIMSNKHLSQSCKDRVGKIIDDKIDELEGNFMFNNDKIIVN